MTRLQQFAERVMTAIIDVWDNPGDRDVKQTDAAARAVLEREVRTFLAPLVPRECVPSKPLSTAHWLDTEVKP